MSSRATIAEQIAKFRNAPPAPRHAREAPSAEPKKFWWQTEGGSRKHLRGAGGDVGEQESDQDVGSKRRSIAGSTQGKGAYGADARLYTSGSAPSNAPAAVTGPHLGAGGSGVIGPSTGAGTNLGSGGSSSIGLRGATNMGAGPSGVKGGSSSSVGEALQVLDQLARTNPSLYAALSSIDEDPSSAEGELSEDTLARIQALLGPPKTSAHAVGNKDVATAPHVDQGRPKMGAGRLTIVKEGSEEEEGEESLQTALNRYRNPGGPNLTAASPPRTSSSSRVAAATTAASAAVPSSRGVPNSFAATTAVAPLPAPQATSTVVSAQQHRAAHAVGASSVNLACPQHPAQQPLNARSSQPTDKPSALGSPADSFSFVPPLQTSTTHAPPIFGPSFKPTQRLVPKTQCSADAARVKSTDSMTCRTVLKHDDMHTKSSAEAPAAAQSSQAEATSAGTHSTSMPVQPALRALTTATLAPTPLAPTVSSDLAPAVTSAPTNTTGKPIAPSSAQQPSTATKASPPANAPVPTSHTPTFAQPMPSTAAPSQAPASHNALSNRPSVASVPEEGRGVGHTAQADRKHAAAEPTSYAAAEGAQVQAIRTPLTHAAPAPGADAAQGATTSPASTMLPLPPNLQAPAKPGRAAAQAAMLPQPPVPQPTPQPATQATPQLATQPTPQSATQPTPQRATQPTPQPATQSTTQTATQPTPQPAKQPTTQSENTQGLPLTSAAPPPTPILTRRQAAAAAALAAALAPEDPTSAPAARSRPATGSHTPGVRGAEVRTQARSQVAGLKSEAGGAPAARPQPDACARGGTTAKSQPDTQVGSVPTARSPPMTRGGVAPVPAAAAPHKRMHAVHPARSCRSALPAEHDPAAALAHTGNTATPPSVASMASQPSSGAVTHARSAPAPPAATAAGSSSDRAGDSFAREGDGSSLGRSLTSAAKAARSSTQVKSVSSGSGSSGSASVKGGRAESGPDQEDANKGSSRPSVSVVASNPEVATAAYQPHRDQRQLARQAHSQPQPHDMQQPHPPSQPNHAHQHTQKLNNQEQPHHAHQPAHKHAQQHAPTQPSRAQEHAQPASEITVRPVPPPHSPPHSPPHPSPHSTQLSPAHPIPHSTQHSPAHPSPHSTQHSPAHPAPLLDVSKGWPAHIPHGVPILLPGANGAPPASMFVPLSPPKHRRTHSPTRPASVSGQPQHTQAHSSTSGPYQPHDQLTHGSLSGRSGHSMFVPAHPGEQPQLLSMPWYLERQPPAPDPPAALHTQGTSSQAHDHTPVAKNIQPQPAQQSPMPVQPNAQQHQQQAGHVSIGPNASQIQQQQSRSGPLTVQSQQQQCNHPTCSQAQQSAAMRSSTSSSSNTTTSSSSRSSFAFQPPQTSATSTAPSQDPPAHYPPMFSKPRSHAAPNHTTQPGFLAAPEHAAQKATDHIPRSGQHSNSNERSMHLNFQPFKPSHQHPPPSLRKVREEGQVLTNNPRKLAAFQAKERRRAERLGGYDFFEEEAAAAAKEQAAAEVKAAKAASRSGSAPGSGLGHGHEFRSSTAAATSSAAGATQLAGAAKQAGPARKACGATSAGQHEEEFDLEGALNAAAKGRAPDNNCKGPASQLPRSRITRLVEEVERTRRDKRDETTRNQEKYKIENMGWEELEDYLGDEAAPVREFRRLKWEMMQLKKAVGSTPPAQLRENFLEKAEAVRGAALEAAVARELERSAEQEQLAQHQATSAHAELNFQQALATQAHHHALSGAQLRGLAAAASPLAALPPSPQDGEKLRHRNALLPPSDHLSPDHISSSPTNQRIHTHSPTHHNSSSCHPMPTTAPTAHATSAAAAAAHLASLGLRSDITDPLWYRSLLAASGSSAVAADQQLGHALGGVGNGTHCTTTAHSLPRRPTGVCATAGTTISKSSSHNSAGSSSDSSADSCSSDDGGGRANKKAAVKQGDGPCGLSGRKRGGKSARKGGVRSNLSPQDEQTQSAISRTAREVEKQLDSAIQGFLLKTGGSAHALPHSPPSSTPAATLPNGSSSSNVLHTCAFSYLPCSSPLLQLSQPPLPHLKSQPPWPLGMQPPPHGGVLHGPSPYADQIAAHDLSSKGAPPAVGYSPPMPGDGTLELMHLQGLNAQLAGPQHEGAHQCLSHGHDLIGNPLVLQAQQQAVEAQQAAQRAQQTTQQRVRDREEEEEEEVRERLREKEQEVQRLRQQEVQDEQQQGQYVQQHWKWQEERSEGGAVGQAWEQQQHQHQQEQQHVRPRQQLDAPPCIPSGTPQAAPMHQAAPVQQQITQATPHPAASASVTHEPAPSPYSPRPDHSRVLNPPFLSNSQHQDHPHGLDPGGSDHQTPLACNHVLTQPSGGQLGPSGSVAPAPMFPNWPTLGSMPGDGLPQLELPQHQHCQLEPPPQQQWHHEEQLQQQQLHQQPWQMPPQLIQTANGITPTPSYQAPPTTETQAAIAAAAFPTPDSMDSHAAPHHHHHHHRRPRERHTDILEMEGASTVSWQSGASASNTGLSNPLSSCADLDQAVPPAAARGAHTALSQTAPANTSATSKDGVSAPPNAATTAVDTVGAPASTPALPTHTVGGAVTSTIAMTASTAGAPALLTCDAHEVGPRMSAASGRDSWLSNAPLGGQQSQPPWHCQPHGAQPQSTQPQGVQQSARSNAITRSSPVPHAAPPCAPHPYQPVPQLAAAENTTPASAPPCAHTQEPCSHPPLALTQDTPPAFVAPPCAHTHESRSHPPLALMAPEAPSYHHCNPLHQSAYTHPDQQPGPYHTHPHHPSGPYAAALQYTPPSDPLALSSLQPYIPPAQFANRPMCARSLSHSPPVPSMPATHHLPPSHPFHLHQYDSSRPTPTYAHHLPGSHPHHLHPIDLNAPSSNHPFSLIPDPTACYAVPRTHNLPSSTNPHQFSTNTHANHRPISSQAPHPASVPPTAASLTHATPYAHLSHAHTHHTHAPQPLLHSAPAPCTQHHGDPSHMHPCTHAAHVRRPLQPPLAINDGRVQRAYNETWEQMHVVYK